MNLTESCRAFFLNHPGESIAHTELARRFGVGGWRTRVADCRDQFGMDIRNDQRVTVKQGKRIVRSYYRYVPKSKAKAA